MGNDGGDIPRRKQLVREKKKAQIPNSQEVAIGRSKFCNLTKEKLRNPLAICSLGYIYNYENILKALVKRNLPKTYSYIRKLNHIKQIKVEFNAQRITCPITKLQYNGFNRFVALWSCGHVLARKVFKEIKSETKKCIICELPYKNSDIIDLNLTGTELELKKTQLLEKYNKKQEQPKEEIDQTIVEKTQKKQYHLNSIDRLDGQFRDVLRDRQHFKEIFHREIEEQWKTNTAKVYKVE